MKTREIHLNDIIRYWTYDSKSNRLIPTAFAISNSKTKKGLNVSIRGTYLHIPIGGSYYAYHRILFQVYHNIEILDHHYLIDHIDGDIFNNDISNLRQSNRSENGCNRILAQCNNRTGHKNIAISKYGFRVVISKKGKPRFEKHFTSLVDALECRNIKLKEYHEEFMNTGTRGVSIII